MKSNFIAYKCQEIVKMNFLRINSKKLLNVNIKSQLAKNVNTGPTGNLSLVEYVAESNDKKMFIAWHPKQKFPYEFSRPIPKHEEKVSSTIIKENCLNSAMLAFKNKHPEVARQELMRITYTTKHRWYPRARDKKAKNTPMDREYL